MIALHQNCQKSKLLSTWEIFELKMLIKASFIIIIINLFKVDQLLIYI